MSAIACQLLKAAGLPLGQLLPFYRGEYCKRCQPTPQRVVAVFRALGNAAASNSPGKQVTVEQQQGKRRTSSGERAQAAMTDGAAIYARFSSENQREASIDDQIRVCTAYLARDGKSVVETYADYAVSGATTLRPGYQALLRDARARRFDVVIAESLDRFSRDQEHIAAFYKHMTFAGVSIVTLAEGTITELHVGLKGTMSALYLKDLAQKTHRGLEGRVRAGRSAGGLCYGYRVIRQFQADGPTQSGQNPGTTWWLVDRLAHIGQRSP